MLCFPIEGMLLILGIVILIVIFVGFSLYGAYREEEYITKIFRDGDNK